MTKDARGVARVTIDRQAKRNALSSAVMHELIGALASIASDEALRAVVLTGAGERAFIGGADVDEMAALDGSAARRFIDLVHRTCHAVRECPVPVLARIDGHVLGAGLELAAACDLRIAGDRSRFGMPEVKLGLPSVVEAALLPTLIGAGRARWLVYTGETIDATRALQWGLVEEVVPAPELDAAVDRLVESMLANGPRAMRLQKQLCRAWDEQPLDAAISSSIDTFAAAWAADEPGRMLGDFVRARAARKRGAS